MPNAQYNQIIPTCKLVLVQQQSGSTTLNRKPGPRIMPYNNLFIINYLLLIIYCRFCDTTTNEGVYTFFKNGVPAAILNNKTGNAKKEILLVRSGTPLIYLLAINYEALLTMI